MGVGGGEDAGSREQGAGELRFASLKTGLPPSPSGTELLVVRKFGWT